jgi:hypothetical protein
MAHKLINASQSPPAGCRCTAYARPPPRRRPAYMKANRLTDRTHIAETRITQFVPASRTIDWITVSNSHCVARQSTDRKSKNYEHRPR